MLSQKVHNTVKLYPFIKKHFLTTIRGTPQVLRDSYQKYPVRRKHILLKLQLMTKYRNTQQALHTEGILTYKIRSHPEIIAWIINDIHRNGAM